MILTTSRKPSRKTRRLAKVLARFMNWRYVNRGKLSIHDLFEMLENENLGIINEIKGNPAFLTIFNSKKEILLRLRFNVGEVNKLKIGRETVVFRGSPPFDPLLLGAMPQSKAGLKLTRKMEWKKEVVVKKTADSLILKFIYGGKPVLNLRVLKAYESKSRG
jgi:U3 small nucleolar ribonucleoprotein protein IMP4